MKKGSIYNLLLACIILFLTSCVQSHDEHRVVLCVPVYGQSLALGEEAERITDFDSLAHYADGRIVTENLDHQFGYFEAICQEVSKIPKTSLRIVNLHNGKTLNRCYWQ